MQTRQLACLCTLHRHVVDKCLRQEEQSKHFIDIDLGDWAGNNIRARAEEGGTKDIYDSYYDYSSSCTSRRLVGSGNFWNNVGRESLFIDYSVFPGNIRAISLP